MYTGEDSMVLHDKNPSNGTVHMYRTDWELDTYYRALESAAQLLNNF